MEGASFAAFAGKGWEREGVKKTVFIEQCWSGPEEEPEGLAKDTSDPPFAGRSRKNRGRSSKEWGTQSFFPGHN